MSVLFKDRDASGKPLARVSVDYWVIREDLVTSAIRVLDSRVFGSSFTVEAAIAGAASELTKRTQSSFTVEEAIAGAASELTKRTIEAQLKEDLAVKGQDWFEYEIGPYLVRSEWELVYRVAAEKAVSRLWPGAK